MQALDLPKFDEVSSETITPNNMDLWVNFVFGMSVGVFVCQ